MAFSRYFLVCLTTLALGASFPVLGNTESLQEAGRLLKRGQASQALDQVDKYLSDKPKDAQGRFLKGVILTELNRANEATAIFMKLAEEYPDLPEPHNNLAVIYAQQKQYEKAKQELESAIRTHPAYATAHENLGDIYARMASQAYDKALQIDSSNTSAQTKLAMIRDLAGARPISGTLVAMGKPTVPAEPPTKPIDTKPVETKPAPPVTNVAPPANPPKTADKPVETKPITPAGNPAADVAKAARDWAAAWSAKDVRSYLAHYAGSFKVPGGQNREQWERERTARITKPGAISVTLDDITVVMDGADRASVRFRQHYRSANLNSSSSKSLVFVRHNSKWLIEQEQLGK